MLKEKALYNFVDFIVKYWQNLVNYYIFWLLVITFQCTIIIVETMMFVFWPFVIYYCFLQVFQNNYLNIKSGQSIMKFYHFQDGFFISSIMFLRLIFFIYLKKLLNDFEVLKKDVSIYTHLVQHVSAFFYTTQAFPFPSPIYVWTHGLDE